MAFSPYKTLICLLAYSRLIAFSEAPLTNITDNVWLQDDTRPLFEIIANVAGRYKAQDRQNIEFVHVVNPLNIPSRIAEQEAAFDSLKRASVLAMNSPIRSCKVSFVAAAYMEDCEFAKVHFDHIARLEKSSSDIFSFAVPRKLPLLFDVIMTAQADGVPATHVIYTNSDICLSAGFYEAIATLLDLGFEAITVNRRDIPANADQGKLLPLMECLIGRKHPGFDCFIFPRHWLDDLVKTDAVIGMPGVARSLLYNLVAHAQRMLLLNDVSLTFHVGSDAAWRAPQYADYRDFNYAQARRIYPALVGEGKERLHEFCRVYGERPIMSGIPNTGL